MARFDLVRLLAGSEGTLAFTKAATLRLTPLPKHRLLMVARYGSFDAALRDVRHLLAADPLAIEILDDKVLELASRDVIWSGLESVLGGPAAAPVRGLNVIEFAGDDRAALAPRPPSVARRCWPTRPIPPWTGSRVDDPAAMAQLWTLREKSVGLMGRLGEMEGSRRQGTAFVEDTAVPPERLADYVAEFRAMLDRHGLGYGMYGHADVGCLHVRPSLDMADPAEEAMIRVISDEVAALVKRHGGLIWGEHGRGYRGEFSPLFFGPVLYDELCRIKRAFDPDNLFNPGKLASPGPRRPDRPDRRRAGARQPSTGPSTRTAPRGVDRAVSCNGNAACHQLGRVRRHVPVLPRDARPRAVAEGPGHAAARLGAAAARRRPAGHAVGGGARRRRGRDQGVARHLPVLQGLREPLPRQGRHPGDAVALPRALLRDAPAPAARPAPAPSRDRAGRGAPACPASPGRSWARRRWRGCCASASASSTCRIPLRRAGGRAGAARARGSCCCATASSAPSTGP